MRVIKIDVSQLAPPEPMTAILSALTSLEINQCLQVRHRRQPFPLYEKLNQAGWDHHCIEFEKDKYLIYFFKISDAQQFETLLARLMQDKS